MDMKNNVIALWRCHFPIPPENAHKYDHGHAVIFGAPELTGATRLGASACSRIGAGLVTVLAHSMVNVYRTALPADIMVRECDLNTLSRVKVLLGGSGGISELHRKALYEC